jgi:SAM-dependent methyltransferase
MSKRALARELARKHLSEGDPLGWFEALYSSASYDAAAIPWADLKPNPNLEGWLDARPMPTGRGALKVGCGLGDDAEELARRGFDVTAFDIAPTAIQWCRRRFPRSSARYLVADLLDPPLAWNGNFNLVLESYTLQVLPPDLRERAMRSLAAFLAPAGQLLLICRGREPHEPEGAMPWPLTRQELSNLAKHAGLAEQSFEDFLDGESPPVRRFRSVYGRTPCAAG